MRMHYLIRRFAGVFVLISLALGYWVSPYWLLFTAFVGANLFQSSLTHWCLLERILERAGVPGSSAAGRDYSRLTASGFPSSGRGTASARPWRRGLPLPGCRP